MSMIETMSRVIHPGWLTVMLEDKENGDWRVYHRCTSCGFIVGPLEGKVNGLRDHSLKKHPGEAFNLEIYILRSAFCTLNPYYGLEALQWRQ